MARVPKASAFRPAAASGSEIKPAPKVETVPEKTGSTPEGVISVPFRMNLSVCTVPPLIKSLEFKSKSDDILLGVDPSRDTVLLKALFRDSKLSFKA